MVASFNWNVLVSECFFGKLAVGSFCDKKSPESTAQGLMQRSGREARKMRVRHGLFKLIR